MKGMRHLVVAAAAMAAIATPAVTQAAQESSRREQKREARKRVQITAPRRESRLNRSKHWDHADTYQEARLISPFPHRPVR